MNNIINIFLMIAIIFFSLIVVYFGLIKAYFATNNKSIYAFKFKCYASLSFIILSVLCILFSTYKVINPSRIIVYSALILFAQVFCVIGDIFISLKEIINKEKFKSQNLSEFNTSKIAVLAFFIGHIFFITAMILLQGSKFNKFLLLGAVILPLILITITKVFSFKFSKIEFISLIAYFFALNLSICASIGFLLLGYYKIGSVCFIASMLYAISDSMLGLRDKKPNLFSKSTKKSIAISSYLVLFTYYLAQVLYSISILFVI